MQPISDCLSASARIAAACGQVIADTSAAVTATLCGRPRIDPGPPDVAPRVRSPGAQPATSGAMRRAASGATLAPVDAGQPDETTPLLQPGATQAPQRTHLAPAGWRDANASLRAFKDEAARAVALATPGDMTGACAAIVVLSGRIHTLGARLPDAFEVLLKALNDMGPAGQAQPVQTVRALDETRRDVCWPLVGMLNDEAAGLPAGQKKLLLAELRGMAGDIRDAALRGDALDAIEDGEFDVFRSQVLDAVRQALPLQEPEQVAELRMFAKNMDDCQHIHLRAVELMLQVLETLGTATLLPAGANPPAAPPPKVLDIARLALMETLHAGLHACTTLPREFMAQCFHRVYDVLDALTTPDVISAAAWRLPLDEQHRPDASGAYAFDRLIQFAHRHSRTIADDAKCSAVASLMTSVLLHGIDEGPDDDFSMLCNIAGSIGDPALASKLVREVQERAAERGIDNEQTQSFEVHLVLARATRGDAMQPQAAALASGHAAPRADSPQRRSVLEQLLHQAAQADKPAELARLLTEAASQLPGHEQATMAEALAGRLAHLGEGQRAGFDGLLQALTGLADGWSDLKATDAVVARQARAELDTVKLHTLHALLSAWQRNDTLGEPNRIALLGRMTQVLNSLQTPSVVEQAALLLPPDETEYNRKLDGIYPMAGFVKFLAANQDGLSPAAKVRLVARLVAGVAFYDAPSDMHDGLRTLRVIALTVKDDALVGKLAAEVVNGCQPARLFGGAQVARDFLEALEFSTPSFGAKERIQEARSRSL